MDVAVQVAIVGASLGGASAACVLGRAGVSVALIDRSHFPRRKPCGEGLSSFGRRQLELLGVGRAVDALAPFPYHRYHLYAGDRMVPMRAPWGEGITVPRASFDDLLLRHALTHSSVIPLLGTKIVEASPYRLRTDRGEVRCQLLIVADGTNSPIAQALGATETRYGPSRSGVTATFGGRFQEQLHAITICARSGYEIYCTPLSDSLLNVSILTNARGPYNPRELLLSPETLREAFLRSSFSGELVLPPAGRTGIGNVRRSIAHPDVLLVGDAQEEFDPIGGMGMSHALRSGVLAAESIVCRLREERSLRRGGGSLQEHYTSERRGAAAAMRRFTAICYRTLKLAPHAPSVLRLAGSSLGGAVVRSCTRDLL